MCLYAHKTVYQFYKIISNFLHLIKSSKKGLQINAFSDRGILVADQSKSAIQNMT